MMDDETRRAPRAYLLINLSDDYEVAFWTKTLRVSKERLAESVEAVGHSAEDVAAYLNEDAVADEGKR